MSLTSSENSNSTAVKQVVILGATGSIGLSTLDVLARHPDRFAVFALTANTNVEMMLSQVEQYRPRFAVMRSVPEANLLRDKLKSLSINTEVLSGEAGLCEVAGHDQVDYVMAAIVGAAGLLPTLSAVESGKRVLLANKEALVMSGSLFMDAVKRTGATLLPIDSEHNAIFQCLPEKHLGGLGSYGIERILLTGSGGPFRLTDLEKLHDVTPDQACAHPNWSMGRKISVDSATMMNKGLEFVEACWLFDARVDQVEIVVHPESVVHSMVEYIDGSVLAQLGHPDMRTPIAYGLGWPERIQSGLPLLDLIKVGQLNFEAPDEDRFPCLRLARQAMSAGKTATIVLNAANEIVVEAFLEERVGYTAIPHVIETVLSQAELYEPDSLDAVLNADNDAREKSRAIIRSL